MQLEDIVQKVKELGFKDVCVTGGEPLAQDATKNLLKELVDLGFEVSLETGGSISIAGIDESVKIIMDIIKKIRNIKVTLSISPAKPITLILRGNEKKSNIMIIALKCL